ncbi:LAFA_0E08174g1_1 [Lachancea sp. 'fantastica']|nr:LAFA_0E08174g1_1 [Lachancea sp. 'fantastica']
MSLPLRHPLDTAASLDRVLEDLIVRFIINCPPEDFSSVERELFHVEEANWFYTDFVKILNPNLPNLKIKSFAQHVIKLCPMIWKWDVRAEQALQKFSQYKRSIPVRGAAIFNKKLTKLLLVKGTESDSWSFPRGKISKDENDVDCCVREVLEETGCDISDYIDEEAFIERNIGGKNYKIFLVSGIPEDFNFEPKVRNEIEKIQWHDFKKLSKNCNPKTAQIKIYLVNNLMRPLAMWVKSNRQIDDDEKLKAHVETQLKLLLGIKKEDTPDPGRELLNMLQSSVSAGNATSNQDYDSSQASHTFNNIKSVQESQSTDTNGATAQQPGIPAPTFVGPPPQFQHNFPFMAFQPFAPFPFTNGTGVHIGGVTGPEISSSSSESTQPPPTPKMNSLAKPTVVEEEERHDEDHSQARIPQHVSQNASAKQLLDILHQKGSNQAALPIVQQSMINTTSAKTLLSLLKNPRKETFGQENPETQQPGSVNIETDLHIIPASQVPEASVTSSSASDGSEYEDFESCSGSESEDNLEDDQEDPLESFSARYARDNKHQRKAMEGSNNSLSHEDTREISNHSQNTSPIFAGSAVSEAVTVKSPVASTSSTKSVGAKTQPNRPTDLNKGAQSENQEDRDLKSQGPKPKFKLLKRGEVFNSAHEPNEVDNSLGSPPNTTTASKDDQELSPNIPKDAAKSSQSGITNATPHSNGHSSVNHLMKGTELSDTDKSLGSESLLDLLKKGKPGLCAPQQPSPPPQPQIDLDTGSGQNRTNNGGNELLKMLHGFSSANFMATRGEEASSSPSASVPSPGPIFQTPAENQNASQQLLGLLKKASN